MDIIECEQLDHTKAPEHWYYNSKYNLIRSHLLKLPLEKKTFTTADVGTGLGLFLHKMEKDGLASPDRSMGIDPACRANATAINSLIPIYSEFPENSRFDVILMMDVLEHVEDDLGLLVSAIGQLKTQGYIFITVPALPMLWSSHDRFLGHFRRYTIKSLKELVNKSGVLKIVSCHYYFASILPAAIPVRLSKLKKGTDQSSDMRNIHPIFDLILKQICNVELPISRYNKFAGLTAFALCKLK